MPGDKKEPQSYGSQGDWVSGNTGENVNQQKGTPAPEHAEFYDSRRESEENDTHQGGKVSPVQASENIDVVRPFSTVDERMPTQKVTTEDGGAKRDSYFRDRDYK